MAGCNPMVKLKNKTATDPPEFDFDEQYWDEANAEWTAVPTADNPLTQEQLDPVLDIHRTGAANDDVVEIQPVLLTDRTRRWVIVSRVDTMWIEITGGSGSDYSWKLKVPDGAGGLQDATPAVTGTNTARHVDGLTSVPTGATVLAWHIGVDGSGNPRYLFDDFYRPFVCFAVTVSNDGGSAGDKTTQCDFTYTVTTKNGVQLATAAAPENQRPAAGKLVAATLGMGYYDAAGAFVLSWVNETLAVEACP